MSTSISSSLSRTSHALHSRLQTLLDNKDPPRGRYSLANLPTDVHWNNKLLFDENAMCEVVAIGVLEDTMFTSSRHAEFQRSWITIHLLRDIDCAGVDRIANLANPVRSEYPRIPNPDAISQQF